MKIVKQHDLKDCGICSLLSIIRFYGGNVSLEQLRYDASVTRDGTTALNIILASKKYGFDAVGLKVTSLEDKKIVLPAIAHLNLSNGLQHFVVIYKITKDKIIIMDPAKGKVVMPKDNFLKVWSNILLVFYPKRQITFIKNDKSILKLFFKIIYLDKKLFVSIIIYSILLVLFTISSNYYFKFMLDAIEQNYHISYLYVISLIFAFLIIFKMICEYIKRYLENHLSKNIDVYMNKEFINHIFNLPLNCITSRSSGEIITRVKELASVKILFADTFLNNVLNLTLMLVTLPLLIHINGKLFLILLGSIILYMIVGVITSKIIYKKAYQNIEYEAQFNSTLIENINAIHSIKNLDITNIQLSKIEEVLATYIYDSYKLNSFINKESVWKNIINDTSIFFINTLGLYLVYKRMISIASLITFNFLLGIFIEPLKSCIDNLPRYAFLKATYNKLNDFISVKKEVIGEKGKIISNSITIRNLNYSYNNCHNLITNLNVSIRAGAFVALKGRSGSGKSTLCHIINNYITDYSGDVLIGGENIKDLNIATIRENVMYVSQNENIFTGTIKENILLDRKISKKDFLKVCRICEIENLVSAKPLRYDTTISESLDNISGGEKQRIILARALLKDFSILILDEALSEVDYKLERKIMGRIKRNFQDKTIIYVTHKNHHNIYDDSIIIGD